jgi:hypothetical protein
VRVPPPCGFGISTARTGGGKYFDGRTRQVAAWGKTKTEAANSLRSILKERVKLGGAEGLKSSDRVSVAAELFMANLKALVDEGVRSPGTYYTYRQHLDKNILPRIGEVRLASIHPTGQ